MRKTIADLVQKGFCAHLCYRRGLGVGEGVRVRLRDDLGAFVSDEAPVRLVENRRCSIGDCVRVLFVDRLSA